MPPQAESACEVPRVKRLFVALFACGFVLLLPAQQSDIKNPYTSPEDVAAGGRIFRSHCAACHGSEGVGGRGSALTSGEFHHGGSDAAIFKNISEGIAGTEMPSAFFEGRQLWQLVAYVRSLSERPSNPSHRGDAARGRSLFDGKGGCRNCHQVNGNGGRGGPDLTSIGASRSAGGPERVPPESERTRASQGLPSFRRHNQRTRNIRETAQRRQLLRSTTRRGWESDLPCERRPVRIQHGKVLSHAIVRRRPQR